MKASVYCASAANTRACRRLAEQFKSGMGGNSYLLASPDTLLSECIAFIAVAAENGGDDRLLRRIADGLCDDVRVLGSEGFRAEDADETVSLCRLSPAELKRRAFVLHLSDSSEAAQNKLLKTLEDAPESAVFFVTATSPSLRTSARSLIKRYGYASDNETGRQRHRTRRLSAATALNRQPKRICQRQSRGARVRGQLRPARLYRTCTAQRGRIVRQFKHFHQRLCGRTNRGPRKLRRQRRRGQP